MSASVCGFLRSVLEEQSSPVVASKKCNVDNFKDLVPDIFPSLDAIEALPEDSKAAISRSEVQPGSPAVMIRFQLMTNNKMAVANTLLTIYKNPEGNWCAFAPNLWPMSTPDREFLGEQSTFDITKAPARAWVKNLIEGKVCNRLPDFEYEYAADDQQIAYRLFGLEFAEAGWKKC